jgi:hypothetical protein
MGLDEPGDNSEVGFHVEFVDPDLRSAACSLRESDEGGLVGADVIDDAVLAGDGSAD